MTEIKTEYGSYNVRKEIKTVYLRIIEPTGVTLSDYSIGSGTFPFKGKDLVYTAKQRIFYENNHQSVEFI